MFLKEDKVPRGAVDEIRNVHFIFFEASKRN